MKVLYKYRPLNDFLFKELYYQEIYFASYSELNDPLDLSARIEFSPKDVNQIETLLWFIFKTTLKINSSFEESQLSDKQKINNKKVVDFAQNKELRTKYKETIFKELSKLASEREFISLDDLENILTSIKDIPFLINLSDFKQEIKRLIKKFLENSYTTCFSEDNNDFLMWSHYASKHCGICLEFTLENGNLFPYKITGKREVNKEKYLSRISQWNINEGIVWDRIKKVQYQDKQPYINFFEFAPVRLQTKLDFC